MLSLTTNSSPYRTGRLSACLLAMAGLYASPALAADVHLASTGFSFALIGCDNARPLCIETVGSGTPELVGAFTFDAPGDTAGLFVSGLSITMQLTDGDTDPGNVDEGQLFFGLQGTGGIVMLGTDFSEADPMVIEGFPNGVLATATNTLDLQPFPALSDDILDLLLAHNGVILLYLIDQDVGGNILNFRNSDPGRFQLQITLSPVTSPIPLPGAVGLLVAALCGLSRFRRPVGAKNAS